MADDVARCPKCGTPRRSGLGARSGEHGGGGGSERARGQSAFDRGLAACARCGLAGAHMAKFAAERDAAVPDALTQAWERAVAAWDEPARHDEVIRLVAQHDAYAWAAARYRPRAGDPIGERQLARIRKAAEATLFATATARKDRAPKPYRGLTAILLMLMLAAGAGLLYAMVMRGDTEPPGATVKPVPPIQQTAPRSPTK